MKRQPGGPVLMPSLCVVLALAGAGVAAAQVSDAPDSVDGILRSAVWRGHAWGETVAGSVCWVQGLDGSIRVEVARCATAAALPVAPAWADLLTRGGEGWGALLADDVALGGRWGAPLTVLAPETRLRLATLLALLTAPDGSSAVALPAEVRWLSARVGHGRMVPVVGRAELGPRALALLLPDTGSLRKRLEMRGRGRGGGGETWRVRRMPAASGMSATTIEVVSSRLAGALVVRSTEAWRVRFAPDDVFVPVWTLGEVIEFPGARPTETGGE